MFKKSLIATAIMGVVASGAMAADVEVYGRIDTGFAYTHEKETTNGTSIM